MNVSIETVVFPIQTTQSGDLLVTKADAEQALTRARLLTEIRVGEREMFPQYGCDFQLFSPISDSIYFEGSLLQDNLNKYASDISYSYAVITSANEQTPIQIEILMNR